MGGVSLNTPLRVHNLCVYVSPIYIPQSLSPHIQHQLVKAMSDWYLDSDPVDPSKVLSILEMAKELKVLPIILTANNFPFVIELACWATKMDVLKLEKWFTDKIRDYKVRMSLQGSAQGWSLEWWLEFMKCQVASPQNCGLVLFTSNQF